MIHSHKTDSFEIKPTHLVLFSLFQLFAFWYKLLVSAKE